VKKAKTAKRKPVAKSGGAPKSINKYLAHVPQPGRTTLNKIRAAILSAAPAGTEEIISYGIPAFRYKGVLVWFAAFADHCSLFPTAAVIEAFKKELKPYVISKGTIQFPLNKPLPATLVKKMVKMRVAQVENKKKK
jgi:uncharacterized protein YdhG (YjbR/CyaY superfamily)